MSEQELKATKCCVEVWDRGRATHSWQCGKTAKVVRDGKPYCGLHDPVAEEERRKKRGPTKWEREMASSEAKRKEDAAKDSELSALRAELATMRLERDALRLELERCGGPSPLGATTPWAELKAERAAESAVVETGLAWKQAWPDRDENRELALMKAHFDAINALSAARGRRQGT